MLACAVDLLRVSADMLHGDPAAQHVIRRLASEVDVTAPHIDRVLLERIVDEVPAERRDAAS